MIYALYILVTLHGSGANQVLPMDKVFFSRAQCERYAERWNRGFLLSDVPRDFDAHYFCAPYDGERES